MKPKRKHKLTYWVALILDDHTSYSIRTRTRKECAALRNEYGPERFAKPKKVIVEYTDAFSLVSWVLGEGGYE